MQSTGNKITKNPNDIYKVFNSAGRNIYSFAEK